MSAARPSGAWAGTPSAVNLVNRFNRLDTHFRHRGFGGITGICDMGMALARQNSMAV